MINKHEMADEKTAVERWENEGGRTGTQISIGGGN